jgi:predicted ATPase/DNA-binding CsgD family transcriptional regulator
LDNYEHLLDGAGLVSDILATAPFVKVLVTSRETLNLREEWLWEVHGLSYPQQDVAPPPETYGAIQRFIERAQQVRPGFTLAEACAAVVRICRLVEGMPLALELAANWTKTLSCDAIVDEIQGNIDFLASQARNIPERHRSTRAVFNHSWRLLFAEERSGFPKLSVFDGGFTREAAEQVAGVSLVILASLVDKSLVRQDGRGRYDIHELLRQYGEEQLATTDAIEALKDSHATFFARLIARCESGLKGDRQLSALNTIEADFDNVRAAWAHAVTRRNYHLIDLMIDGLFLYCQMRGRFVEGDALFDMARIALAPAPGENPHPVWGRVLARAPKEDIAPVEEALIIAQAHERETEVAFCLRERGWLHANRRSFAHAYRDYHDSLTLYRRLEDGYGMANAISGLAYVSMTVGDWDAAKMYIDQGSRLAREIGSQTWQANFLFLAGWTACCGGLYEQSECLLGQAEAVAEAMEFHIDAADSCLSLGFLAFLRGDLQQARDYIVDNLEVATRHKEPGSQGFAMIVMAHIACVEENYQRAQQLAEEALVLVKPHPVRERWVARALAMAACGLGDYERARQQVHTVLAQETGSGIRLWTLPMVALIQAHEGDYDRVAALLGLSFTHPASATGWLEYWPLITRLRRRLETQLGAETFAAAWKSGSQLDLDTIVEQVLVETDPQAKQPLVEPLTNRELEVLRLIAEGLSNRAIAEALTIVEGTVRTHVYNLCQKLGARNRTQAVARARVLRIL